jgi:enoyl-CoA hydratase/carnithine racemase
MVDIPLSPDAKITVERRGQIVLIGINRPQMSNRIDPEAFYGLAKAYYDYDNDFTLRAAVLFGHGEHFSRGNDVNAFSTLKAAHLGVNDSADAAAFAELEAEYVALFKSEDFIEGRKAEAENRPPIFEGR